MKDGRIFISTNDNFLYGFDHPFSTKQINGVGYRVCQRLQKPGEHPWFLFEDGQVIGNFKTTKEAEDYINERYT